MLPPAETDLEKPSSAGKALETEAALSSSTCESAAEDVGNRESAAEGAENPESYLDLGPEDAVGQKSRRCLVSGDRQSKRCLIRFVLSPDQEIVPDLQEVLPGRGFWVSATQDAIEIAARKGRFARAARQQVSVSPDLAERLERLLAERCIELLALARRAGQALAGREKVNDAISADGFGKGEIPGLYLTAKDGAHADPQKLKKSGRGLPAYALLTGAELGQTFGRGSVSNVLVAEGGIAHRLSRDLDRLAGFRKLHSGTALSSQNKKTSQRAQKG